MMADKQRPARFLCAAAIAVALIGDGALAQEANSSSNTLNGASSLTETHGDWQVNCQIVNGGKICRFSQQQFNQGTTTERLLAMEVSSSAADAAQGLLAMPFGLSLASGLKVSLDEKPQAQPLVFKTCYPIGCLVEMKLDGAMLEAFKAAQILNLEGVASETGQPVKFTISLNGFTSAFARVVALSTSK